MSRIAEQFAYLKTNQRKGLITFIVAGDPRPDLTLSLMNTMVDAGTDLIELGVPFSDPMADGPVIQRAAERALTYNISIYDITQIVAEFRQHNTKTPVILMGYFNPIENMGYEKFSRLAADAGVDGVLVVDLPAEYATEFQKITADHGIDLIFMVAPTTTKKRQQRIIDVASGFLYYVSLSGVTGSNKLDMDSVQESLDLLKEYSKLPIAVGFGIRHSQVAKAVSKHCDAIIIGSAIIECIEQWQGPPSTLMQAVSHYIKDIRDAIDNTRLVGIEK